ncbi:hypothetical protein [Aestuariivivens sediminicola]|uniref:hypothetical protein n=1 Tax=Aestuariivivens sediminicola TaxID=2913560 RepID=UPI001F58EC51|nr:hypothetical protein [Aestuariivivens sediminicola]
MKKLRIVTCFILFCCAMVYSQYYKFEPSIWKITALSGEVRLSGNYNYGDNILSGENNEVQNSMVSGGLSLFTRSYMYHPNLLSLDVSGGYEPQVGKFQELVRPDYSINNSSKFIRANALFFKRLNYNFNAFYNNYENYSNRENYISIKSVSENYGGILSLNNKVAPASVRYSNTKQDQLELQSKRNIIREEETIEGRVSRKYGKRSETILNLEKTLFKNSILDSTFQSIIKSNIDNYTLENIVQLTNRRDGNMRTRVNYYDFETQNSSRNLFSLNNNLFLELPHQLDFRSNFIYTQLNTNNITENNHQVNGSINHKLYESLNTNINIDFRNQNHSFFNQTNWNFGFNINYNKNIPLNSKLRINYQYRNSIINRNGEISTLNVFDESYYISDEQVSIIENSNVNIESIVVKDTQGTIIYQENLDYILITLGDFIEIKRVPGGLIPNNTSVLIDYTFIQPENFELVNNSMNFKIALEMLTNTFQLYYNFSNRKYKDPKVLQYFKLDFFNRHVYGGKLDFGFITGGIEYDDFDSNIVPFKLLNYYANLNGRFKKRTRFDMSYQRSNYLMIVEEGRTQFFDFLSGNISYFFNNSANLNLNITYRSQQVDDLDLGWLTGRLEYITRINKLILKTNLNYFKRSYNNLDSNFFGGSIQLSRKF